MKKYKCREIKEMMVDYLSGEFNETDPGSKVLEQHLPVCPHCKREYDVLKRIYSESRQINHDADTVMQTVDWAENARDISLGIHINQYHRRPRTWSFSLPSVNWKLAVPALAGVFILGICLGYLLFYRGPQRSLTMEDLLNQDNNAVIDRLETTLTRREMQGYFQQTQLLLTDVMRQCDENGSPWSNGLSRQRVQVLLNKNRYFNEDLDNPDLLSTRRLLKKIEWLLYEMIELDENSSCRQLQRLQDYIREEKLLLKLRLVGKDISYNEVTNEKYN